MISGNSIIEIMINCKNYPYSTIIYLIVYFSYLFIFIPQGKAQIIDSSQLDCELINSGAAVVTSEGIKSVNMFCDFIEKQTQLEVLEIPSQQQSSTKIEKLAWGNPYNLNGNICRDFATSTVCLTPQSAAKLRWKK